MTTHKHQPPWTDRLFKELADRYAQGESASKIARYFAEVHGLSFTRSAIIGKIHRSGIAATSPRARNKLRNGPIRNKSKAQNSAAARKGAVTAQQNKPPTSSSWFALQRVSQGKAPSPVYTAESGRAFDNERVDRGLLTFDDIDARHCLWPIGDPKEPGFGYCGAKRVAGVSYCKHHLERSRTDPVILSPANDSQKMVKKLEGVD